MIILSADNVWYTYDIFLSSWKDIFCFWKRMLHQGQQNMQTGRAGARHSSFLTTVENSLGCFNIRYINIYLARLCLKFRDPVSLKQRFTSILEVNGTWRRTQRVSQMDCPERIVLLISIISLFYKGYFWIRTREPAAFVTWIWQGWSLPFVTSIIPSESV